MDVPNSQPAGVSFTPQGIQDQRQAKSPFILSIRLMS